MRKTIEKLLSSDVTGYKIEMNTGVRQSNISEIRNGKRQLDNLSLKNAEKLYEYQVGLDFLSSVKFEEVNLDDVENYGEELYRGFYEVMRNSADNGYAVSFVSITEVVVNGATVYELMDSWTDELDIEKNLAELEADIIANEMQQENYYFNNYRDAEKYAEYKFNPKTLELLISEYK